MHKFGTRGLRVVLLSAVMVPAAFTVEVVATSVAANAATHSKVHHAGATSATLSVPASVSVGSSFEISGTGYDPTQSAWINVTTSTSQGWMSASVDASGNLSLSLTVYTAGTVTLQASQGGVTLASASTSAS